jgi:TonB family protein
MKNPRVHFCFRLFLIVAVLPLLALFLPGCANDESFFAGNYVQQVQPVVIPAAPAPNPFAQYDNVFICAISNQWFKAVQALPTPPPPGTVVVGFQLNLDGSINDLQVVESAMDEKYNSLCMKVVTDASPFASWPDEMRQACTNGYRDIRYRFDFK